MKLKNLLLSFPLQFPLWFVLVFGVRYLTDLNLWWCLLISFVLILMYSTGDFIQRGD